MNVRCPSCETLYRVDPAKVPDQGIQASCAECPAVITVSHATDDQAVDVSSELTSPDVGLDMLVPPPLVAADQVPDSIADQSPQMEVPAIAEDGPEAVNYGADIFDHSSTIEAPPAPDQQEVVDSELPPLSETHVFEEDLTLPEVLEPTEMAEPVQAFESAVSEPLVVDEIPPLPEAPSPAEAVEEEELPAVDELPPVPGLSEPQESTDLEIPAPEPEPTERPALEVMPAEEPPTPVQPRRYTRPFLRRPEEASPSPAPPASGPMRPTAPVFRPTPGMPIQRPPEPEPDPTPLVDVAPAPPAPQRTTPTDVAPEPEPIRPVDVTHAAPVLDPQPAVEASPPTPPPGVESTVQEPASVVQPEASPAAPEKPQPRKPVNPFLSKDPKQKARRLARALVSDMIVYQPQKRQDALAAGTLKEAFDEEIKKSWEEYLDQVGNELATQTDFFKDALNEILAGGNEIF